MKKLIFFLLFVALFCSCSRLTNSNIVQVYEDENVINIDLSSAFSQEEFVVNDILEEIKIIKLENTDSSLIGKINHVVFSDEYIYVHDNYQNGSVIIFTKEGKFVKRLTKGNGPGEINIVTDITFNKKANQLVVNQTNFIKKYTPDGTFIDEYYIPFIIQNIISYNDDYLCSQLPSQNEEHKLSIICLDSLTNVKNTSFINKDLIDYLSYNNFALGSDGSINIIQPFNNMIFAYQDSSIVVKYKLNLGNNNFVPDAIVDIKTFEENFKEDQYAFTGNYTETDNYQYYRVDKGDMSFYNIYYNKTTKKYRSGLKINFTLPEVLLGCGDYAGSYNNYFVRVFHPEVIPSQRFQETFDNIGIVTKTDADFIKTITSNDNPVIVLYKLKDIQD
ncbi:MAG: 6-bladed beta-propeller [Bacteroidales bacterium]|nr:6-bladed beta-propeller [Bacteroidales bacterium]